MILCIFWYGILHAFGPDHLTAIAGTFPLGKITQRQLLITFLFAIGHGFSLFVLAKILQNMEISDNILAYGDIISAVVIIGMGLYILFMVYSNRIHLRKHSHNGKEHSHNIEETSSFTMGLLMGIGGVRGMLVTLGAIHGGDVNLGMVGLFTLGVMIVFVSFGLLILYINQNFLGNITNVKRVFTLAGVISLIIGTEILIG